MSDPLKRARKAQKLSNTFDDIQTKMQTLSDQLSSVIGKWNNFTSKEQNFAKNYYNSAWSVPVSYINNNMNNYNELIKAINTVIDNAGASILVITVTGSATTK